MRPAPGRPRGTRLRGHEPAPGLFLVSVLVDVGHARPDLLPAPRDQRDRGEQTRGDRTDQVRVGAAQQTEGQQADSDDDEQQTSDNHGTSSAAVVPDMSSGLTSQARFGDRTRCQGSDWGVVVRSLAR